MKKIWAVINLSAEETAQPILSALFSKEEFNPYNAILIEDKMVLAEAFFEEIPPQKIAEAIGGYRNVRCGFGEVSEECLKKGGKSSEQSHFKKADEKDTPAKTTNEENGDSSDEDVPPTEPTGEAAGEPPHDESNNGGNGEDVPPTVPAVKSGRSKPRKAPDHIQEIDDIAQKCVSYKQFASEVAKWLEVGKRESYVVDLFEVAATAEKLSWTLIEKELAKKGYSNPFAMRQRTSLDVTKKLTRVNIDCSFIALVEYVTKYKNYDFRPNIEAKVKQILSEMGIENEEPELQSQITNIAIKAVMVDLDNANMKHICTEAGYGKDEDDILDAKMNFSDFVNKFLQKQGIGMVAAEDFIGRLREAVYNGISIC